jgi:hypothetical protein
MAMNDYGNTPPNTGNDAEADEEYGGSGASVKCLHIYAMPDGSFTVEESTGAPPKDGERAANLDEVLMAVEATFSQGEDPDAMAAAQKGYGKPREMQAPNPGGLFGE